MKQVECSINQITPDAVTTDLRALFHADDPMPSRAPSVLKGVEVGKIFAY